MSSRGSERRGRPHTRGVETVSVGDTGVCTRAPRDRRYTQAVALASVQTMSVSTDGGPTGGVSG